MKFVDEAVIVVHGGNGGDGALSFRREKFVPRGGPDGGDGGRGGSVYLVGNAGLNTLADFRYTRRFEGAHGARGGGRNCTGHAGADRRVLVPLGTIVTDVESGDVIGEVTHAEQELLVARGGQGGVGNTRFKSSVNRTPTRIIPGGTGEERSVRLELQLLADVGLVGLPNAGKSTLLRALSDARPKVADYPFTTLYPQLGVVRVEAHRSFVMTDIPGLIEGAHKGVGLGIQFLRHVSRTRILLHLVDVGPLAGDPVDGVNSVSRELAEFDPELLKRERWLVLNKIDLLMADDRASQRQSLEEALAWKGPVFLVSGATGEGCVSLARALMARLEAGPASSDE
ncbi:MAG: Obg family GTPase CgtA [Acidiferrobacteraceae bacterium]